MVTFREIVMVHDMKRQGLRRLGHRQTDRPRPQDHAQYLDQGMESVRYGSRQPQPRLIDPYADYLRGRVAAFPGLSGRHLWREIAVMPRYDRTHMGLMFMGGSPFQWVRIDWRLPNPAPRSASNCRGVALPGHRRSGASCV